MGKIHHYFNICNEKALSISIEVLSHQSWWIRYDIEI